jgi:2-succinyl-5-enolpyruvyl-6-hydroxy-3-cyclohexene-1-carboxylate synthase
MSATAQARTVLTELVAAGVSDLVIAPGSRNGPISLAALAHPQLNVNVRIDERSAAFTALGIAKVTGKKVAVVVTSGTAGAHLLPALIEAAQSDLDLIAITADRPKNLVNTGANQTIEQLELFLAATNNVVDLDSSWPAEMWRNELSIALAKPGVIHLNPRFAEPLVPSDQWQPTLVEQVAVAKSMEKIDASAYLNGRNGVVVTSGDEISHASEIAQRLNWPLIAEPAASHDANLISNSPLVLPMLADQVEVVLTVGRVGLARSVNNLINNKPRIAIRVPSALTNLDAIMKTAGSLDSSKLTAESHDWLNRWQDCASEINDQVSATLNGADLSGLHVANLLLENLKSSNLLFAAASLSLRDLDYLMRPNAIGMLTANRGVNGIDGIVATAIGSALAWQRNGGGQSYCLLGDVALLHDLSSLTIPTTEELPNLRLVIVDNNGGGVFSTIEQRGVSGFERVFGTPHRADLTQVLTGLGIPTIEISQKLDLPKIFNESTGLSAVVITGIDRDLEADLRKQLVNLAR